MTTPRTKATGGSGRASDKPYKNNPEVDAKIDAYIQGNPDYWKYIKEMPRERLERTVVLNEVRELERQQFIREGVLERIKANPELKQAYELLMKDVPEDRREAVMVRMERQQWRAKRSQRPEGQNRETVSNGV